MTTTPVKVDLFGDLYKSVLTYINTSGKKETFDTEVIPEQGYNAMSQLVGVNVDVFRGFIKDLDQPIEDFDSSRLTNRKTVLESLRNKFMAEIMPLVKKNIDNFRLPGDDQPQTAIRELNLMDLGLSNEKFNKIKNECESKSDQKNVLKVVGSNVKKLSESQRNAAKNTCILQTAIRTEKDASAKDLLLNNISNKLQQSASAGIGLAYDNINKMNVFKFKADQKNVNDVIAGCINSIDEENVINTVGLNSNPDYDIVMDCISNFDVVNKNTKGGMNINHQPQMESNQQPLLVQLIKENVDSFSIFIVRIIDMAIEHTDERIKYGKAQNSEYFTVSLITSNIPEKGRRVMSRVLERYGMKFDDFIQVINKFELKAVDLTEEERKSRLRVLLILRQLLDVFNTVIFRSVVQFSSFSDDDENVQKNVNNEIKILDLMKYIAEYVIDLHIREIYKNLKPIEKRKIGFHFEKFAPSFPNYLVEANNRTLDQVRQQLDSCNNQNEEHVKSIVKIEKMFFVAIGVIVLLCIVMCIMYFMRGSSNVTPMPMMPQQMMNYR
jgi:hypothetical protein